MEADMKKDPLISNEKCDIPTRDNLSNTNNKYYKHDTIVNLYNDIKLYDQQVAEQSSDIDESIDVEVKEDILKVSNGSQSVFRRPVLLIAILLIAVAIFVLCPFLQLAQDSHEDLPTDDNDTRSMQLKETEDTASLVQINNLWDG